MCENGTSLLALSYDFQEHANLACATCMCELLMKYLVQTNIEYHHFVWSEN